MSTVQDRPLARLRVSLDEDGPIPIREHRPVTAFPSVLPHAIPRMDGLHQPPERLLPGPHDEMHMVRHDTPRQHLRVRPRLRTPQQRQILLPLRGPSKVVAPLKATRYQVKDTTFNVNTVLVRPAPFLC